MFTIKQILYKQSKIIPAKCKKEFSQFGFGYNPLDTYQSPYSQGTIHIKTVVRGDLSELNNSENIFASP